VVYPLQNGKDVITYTLNIIGLQWIYCNATLPIVVIWLDKFQVLLLLIEAIVKLEIRIIKRLFQLSLQWAGLYFKW